MPSATRLAAEAFPTAGTAAGPRHLRAADPTDTAARLVDRHLPAMRLPATDGSTVHLAALGPGRTILYVYPLTGRPGVDLPEGWETIPGARGCTAEACAFRDHHEDLRAAGAQRVYGLSAQARDYQRELVDRLGLPFTLLADPELRIGAALGLPMLDAGGLTLYRRITLVAAGGRIEHVFHPVLRPELHACEVLDWLRAHP
jgi:peroxiredoxin